MCGWAVVEVVDGEIYLLESGRWSLAKTSDGWKADRFLRMTALMSEVASRHTIDLVVCEKPGHYRNWDATYGCYGVAAHAESWAAARKIRFVWVPITDLKMLATGRGRAEKHEMIAAVARIFGHTPDTDDEADAVLAGFEIARRCTI